MGIINILARTVIGKKKSNQQSHTENHLKANLPRHFKNKTSKFIPAKGGRREDLPKPVRSKMEANVWRFFKYIKFKHGKIDVEYEPEIFQLYDPSTKGVVWYIPDFKISSATHTHYVEVKGVMDERAIKKARLFEQNYSGLRLLFITPEKYKLIEEIYRPFIKNWE